MKSSKKQKSEKEPPAVEDPGALKQTEAPASWKTMTGTGFTKALAREIVRNLSNLGQITTKPFRRSPKVETLESRETIGEYPMVVDTSVLIDGRILPMVNSGFIVGTLVIPQVVLGEVQHIADSPDSVRRAKGRRGLEVAGKLKGQKANPLIHVKVVHDDVPEEREVDHKLAALAKRWDAKLVTVDFNLAQYARAQGIKILNINDLAQALKMAIVPGEELTLKITHEGREREQGVGYLSDGTMIVIDQARSLVGQDAVVVITKIHQTPAGQLFFGRLK
ncbi:MAG: PIN domain-containing protein [Patescibacteria group bacterium]